MGLPSSNPADVCSGAVTGLPADAVGSLPTRVPPSLAPVSEPSALPDLEVGHVRRHAAEDDRLDSLRSYGVLDTPRETTYDALTALAAQLFETPFAIITLVDD